MDKAKKLALIYRHTHKDAKCARQLDGEKSILVLVPNAGTCLVALKDLTDEQIADKLPYAIHKEAERVGVEGVDYVAILTAAFAAPVVNEPSGCGRVYVAITDTLHVNAIKNAAKKIGKLFLTKGQRGDRNVLYIGYDNATGYELGRGTAVLNVLKAAGIGAYRNEHGD